MDTIFEKYLFAPRKIIQFSNVILIVIVGKFEQHSHLLRPPLSIEVSCNSSHLVEFAVQSIVQAVQVVGMKLSSCFLVTLFCLCCLQAVIFLIPATACPSRCPLIILSRGLSILLIFSKNLFFHVNDFCYCISVLHSIDASSNLYYSSSLLALNLVYCSSGIAPCIVGCAHSLCPRAPDATRLGLRITRPALHMSSL